MKSNFFGDTLHQTLRSLTEILSKINYVNQSRNYPFVILLSIISYEVAKINMQVIFKGAHGSLFDDFWTLSSVIGSTLLGFFSDRFFRCSWRKPICLIGIFFSFVTGLAFLHPALHQPSNKFPILFFIFLNGFSASYLGAARAFYLDQFSKYKIFRFSITVVFQCIPWLVMGCLLAEQWITPAFLNYFSVVLIGIIFFSNVFFARDKRKPQFESRHGESELKKLSYKYNHIKYWSIILSFLILAASYHLMPYVGEYTFPLGAFYQEICLLGLGVGIGVPIAFIFIKTPTLHALKTGYAICVLYFLALGFFYWTGLIDIEKTLKYQFLIFAVLGGVLWILSLKDFLKKSKFIEDGLVLGFIESIQSLGEFTGAVLSTLISASIAMKRQVNIKLFLILLSLAFAVVCLKSITKYIKKLKRKLKI